MDPRRPHDEPPFAVNFDACQLARLATVDFYLSLPLERGKEIPSRDKAEVIRLGRIWQELRAVPLVPRETMETRRRAIALAREAEIEEEDDNQ